MVAAESGRLTRWWHRLTRNPFQDRQGRPLLVHCCYHKIGTTWFRAVLAAVAQEYGLRLEIEPEAVAHQPAPRTELFFHAHSMLDPTILPAYRGSHMVRDPRDVVVSGYFYHLWTSEPWANVPREEYGGRSYTQHLSGLDKEQGLQAEIERAAGRQIRQMGEWDYDNAAFFEFRYEDIIMDEKAVFAALFRHYGFNDAAVARCVHLSEQFSFRNRVKRDIGRVNERSHLRSGKPGQWREHFSAAHKARFKELTGDLLVRLGYETDTRW